MTHINHHKEEKMTTGNVLMELKDLAKRPRRIVIMVGSDNDLKKQCLGGLRLLKEAEEKGIIEVVMVFTNSIHRNTDVTLQNVAMISESGDIDVIIVGAGMANHLTGTVDAYLRYALNDTKVVVIGVAFEGETEKANQAAMLSIEQVPGTQVVFDRNAFFSVEGFAEACRFAVEEELPQIKPATPREAKKRTLDEAIAFAEAV